MIFQTEADALAWYVGEERVLSPSFLASIPWGEVKRHALHEAYIPILLYMRDIESFTTTYYEQLLKTPTSRDPSIRAFIDRWSAEETLHGDLLQRFLEEAGVPVSNSWYEAMKMKLPTGYAVKQALASGLSQAIGSNFTAVHMTWGAIQEFSTLNGYQRLWEGAKHPVLEQILRGIVREEARHAFFYWSVARIKLAKSAWSQKLTRFFVDYFWKPVGEGAKTTGETNHVIRVLFAGDQGLKLMDERVNGQLERLPGMQGLKTVTDRISSIIHG